MLVNSAFLFVQEFLLVLGHFSEISPEFGPVRSPVRHRTGPPESGPAEASKVRSGSGPARTGKNRVRLIPIEDLYQIFLCSLSF